MDLAVIHVVGDLRSSAGGIASILSSLSNYLEGDGVHNRFIAYHGQPPREGGGLRTVTARGGLHAVGLANKEAISRMIVAHVGRPLVLHSHGLWSPLNFLAVNVAVQHNIPVVISPHGMLMPWARNYKKYRKRLAWWLYERRSLARANLVHVTSQIEAESVIRAGYRGRITEVGFGTDIGHQNADELRSIRLQNKILLFLGRIHPVKNLSTLISAFARARPTEWKLAIVGPDEIGHAAMLKAQVQGLGLESQVIFEGPAYGAEKQRLLRAASALVLPSFSENYGAVVAEALAQSLPVIVSTGTPWASVLEERCGWWVKPDEQGLTAAIMALTSTDAAILEEMGLRGRMFAERALSWRACSERMIALYRSIRRD